MKIYLNVENLTYRLSVGDEDVERRSDAAPIPVGLDTVFDEAEIQGRLDSTSGGGADWKAGKQWEEHLSAARFCPYVNARAMDVTITTSSQRELPAEEVDDNELVVSRLAGFEGRDFTLIIRAKKIYSSRPCRKELFEQITELAKEKSSSQEQGSLTLYYLGEGEELNQIVGHYLASLISCPEENQYPREELHFLNHQVVGRIGVVGYDFQRLIQVQEDQKSCWVISPDHLDQPIELTSGWWLLTHPQPVDDEID